MRALKIAIVYAAVLSACGRPPPPASPDGSVADPLPPMPAWIEPLVGKTVAEAFPGTGEACQGYVDAVQARYGGGKDGVQIAGWAWSLTGSHVYSRFVVADAQGVIQGGGEGGVDRADVTAAIAAITDPKVGYTALSKQTTGEAHVYGIADTAACHIGPPLAL